MRTLYLDIETSPMVAYAWRTFKENIGVDQIITAPRVICMAWAWDDKPVKFAAEWTTYDFVAQLHSLLDRADVVVHYNGESFDVPHLNREFLEHGLQPPSPYAQVDVYKTVRKMFRFPSNRLAWVSKVLTDSEKIHTDFTLWSRVLDGEVSARKEMRDYNKQDVVALRDIYTRLQPWIPSHPNVGLYADGEAPVCLSCGGSSLESRGFAFTTAGKFRRFVCRDCGRWMRSAKRESTTPMREARL